MIYVFTCATPKCVNNLAPVYLEDVTNPVWCSLCGTYTDALPDQTPTPTQKATK